MAIPQDEQLANCTAASSACLPYQIATQLLADGDVTHCFSNVHRAEELILFWAPFLSSGGKAAISNTLTGRS